MISYKHRRKYKYNLHSFLTHETGIKLASSHYGKFIVMHINGTLLIKPGYSWDGPSGPTIDTKNFMRGSLIHDALYQLMRENVLLQSDRKKADEILRTVCLEDGMSKFRAWYVYKGVRAGGASSAKPDLKHAP